MLLYDNVLWLLLAALAIDALIGDPDWLWRRFPHPVVWIGKIIGSLDGALNRDDLPAGTRKLLGTLVAVLLVAGGLTAGLILHLAADVVPGGSALTILVAAVFLAQRSLYDHVAAVANGLRTGGLAGGRKAVAMIVGRDPEQLDEAGVARAAIESCAENFSDGVVAPAFWFAVLGLPGLLAYKAVNTADSMIGHKTARHGDFGWASARLDDYVNLPASRLAGLFIALSAAVVGGSITASLKVMLRDARNHRSPNAGWPEAAMAGALGVALAGPRAYPGYTVRDPYLNASGRRDIGADTIAAALRILLGASLVGATLVAALAWASG